MIHAADYRMRAEDCARKAAEAKDDYHRKNFQQLAVMWTEMAEKVEGRGLVAHNDIEDALATIESASQIPARGNR
jgi:hypothetical protein